MINIENQLYVLGVKIMYKIGLSSCAKTICEELFQNYKKAGIEKMEISPNYDQYGDIDYENIKKWADKYNIDLWSFHMPFWPFTDIEISNPDTAKATIKYYEEFIKKGTDIGIKRYIVHPSGEPILDEKRAERMECSKESLKTLAQIAKNNDAIIVVEDLPRTCLGRNSDEIAELISVDENLMVCFDTNHLLSEDPVDFIHKIGNRIITTHVSDYDFVDERHWLPGEGKMDWQGIMRAFKDINYDGVWLYEVGFLAPDELIRERDLNCQDIVNNAKEIFENKELTVLSTKKENY